MDPRIDTVSLNGTTFQLEQPGADLLREYLEEATASLIEDPDLGEIMADLERTIAEKLTAAMGVDGVVAGSEVAWILKEIGPVREETAPRPPRKLYRLRLEGDPWYFYGLCTGFAAYSRIDLAIIRLIASVLILISGGVGFWVYLVLGAIPEATTNAEWAEALGSASDDPVVLERLKARLRKQANRFHQLQISEMDWGGVGRSGPRSR